MYNKFVSEVRALQTKSAHVRQLVNMYQGLGLSATVLGAAAAITSPWALVPAAVGAVMYGGAVLTERDRTGKLALLPFSGEDLASTANRSLNSDGVAATLPLQDTHYLSLEEKALFYLVSEEGPRLTHISRSMDEDQFDYIVDRLVGRLIQHPMFLQHPHAIEAGLVKAGEVPPDFFFQDALGSLPHEAKQLLPPDIFTARPAPAGAMPQPTNATSRAISQEPQLQPQSEIVFEDEPVIDVTPITEESTDISKEDLFDYAGMPLLLLFGAPGSGKTTNAEYIAYTAAEAGWMLAIADPHFRKTTWPGMPIHGAGKNYAECNQLMHSTLIESNRRYKARAEDGTRPEAFTPILLVLDEFTDWASNCDLSQDFVVAAIQDFRKVNIHVLMISHSNTLAGIGGPKSFKAAFENTAIQLELLIHGVKVNGQKVPRPNGYANVTESGVRKGKLSVPNLKDWQPPTGLQIRAFGKAALTPAPATPTTPTDEPLLAGTNKTIASALGSVEKLIARTDKPIKLASLVQAFQSSDRDMMAPHMSALAIMLVTQKPNDFRLTSDNEGAKICKA